MTKCVCTSGKSFSRCCGRFLREGKPARTVEQLMRSRYSAYALGGYGDYLLATWFPVTAPDLDAGDLSRREHDWQGLEIVASEQQGDDGTVEFKAWYQQANTYELAVHHERSVFKRVKGRWLYVGVEQ